MHFCYVDESGDSQPIKHRTDDKQPMLVVTGLFVDAGSISNITREFIALKRKYYPKKFAFLHHDLDVLLVEIKGSDIRRDIRTKPGNSAIVNHHFRFLDDVIALCKRHHVFIVSRIWIKEFGVPLADKSIYTITMQHIALRFQAYLAKQGSRGAIIADFRDPQRNQYVAHSVFTQKHKQKGDAYPLIEETATFGMSNNHACLQINDLFCSALLAPIAGHVVCSPYITNVHTGAAFSVVCDRYRKRLQAMQFHCKYQENMCWGVTVRDPHGHKRSIF